MTIITKKFFLDHLYGCLVKKDYDPPRDIVKISGEYLSKRSVNCIFDKCSFSASVHIVSCYFHLMASKKCPTKYQIGKQGLEMLARIPASLKN